MNVTVLQAAMRRDANQVLDMLDRWDERLQGHLNEKRDHRRRSYRSIVTVTPKVAGQTKEEERSFEVIARNLSPSGLAFIYRELLDIAKIEICLNPSTGDSRVLQAEICRKRQVHNDFWEYGVSFIDEANTDSE